MSFKINNGDQLFQNINAKVSLKANYGNYLSIEGVNKISLTNSGVPVLTVVNPNIAVPTQSIKGNDICSSVSFLTDINNIAGKVCSITFSIPFNKKPYIFITPSNNTSFGNLYWMNNTTTGFDVYFYGTIADNSTFKFTYLAIESLE